MIDAAIREYICSCIKKKVPDSAKKINKRIEESGNTLSYDLSASDQEILRINRVIEENGEISDSFVAFWIGELASILSQQRFTTHVPKITHPGISEIPGLIAYSSTEPDGYIRTGNVPFILDSTGNAGALGATEFLSILVNGIPLYQHVLDNTDVAKQLYVFLGDKGKEVQVAFSAALDPPKNDSTDSRARQVFFPINQDDYVIITPLVSMPVMHRLKSIVSENQDYIQNPLGSEEKSPESAIDFEKKNQFLEGGYWTLPGLIDIRFGGKKPQNISSMNSKAKSYKLISSMPPVLRKRKARIPKSDFFIESIYSKNGRYKELFIKLDILMRGDRNNLKIRKQRDAYVLSIMEEVAQDVFSVRQEISHLNQIYKGNLGSAQYRMLYEDEERYNDDSWLDEICEKFARWFFDSYRKVVSNPLPLGQDEFLYVNSYALENKEVFIQ